MQKALANYAELNVSMVCAELSSDMLSIDLRFSMKILIACTSTTFFHIHHPEVIGIGSYRVYCLTERNLYFKSEAIEFNNLQWIQGEICAEDYDPATRWMVNQDELNVMSERSPEQDQWAIGDSDIAFPVYRAWRREHRMKLIRQFEFPSVQPWSSPLTFSLLRGVKERDGILSHTNDEVLICIEQRSSYFLACIVSIGDKVEKSRYVEVQDHRDEFIEKCLC